MHRPAIAGGEILLYTPLNNVCEAGCQENLIWKEYSVARFVLF